MIEGEFGYVYAVAVVDNRHGKGVVVELSQPPAGWRVPAVYLYLRCFKGDGSLAVTPELVHKDDVEECWWNLTGLELIECLGERSGRNNGKRRKR